MSMAEPKRYLVVNGGFEIREINRLPIDDVHYAMYKHNFNLDELQRNLSPQVFEMAKDAKMHLDMQNPPNMAAYVRKFKSYNHLLLIQYMLSQLRNKDGPHPAVHGVSGAINGNVGQPNVYEVQLSPGFCARFDVPQSSMMAGRIRLQIYNPQGNGDEIQGRVFNFDEPTRTVQFWVPNNYPVPNRQFIVRFEPSRFLYNARHFILNNMERLESLISFLNDPKPNEYRRLNHHEFLDRRARIMDSIQFSSDCFSREQREAIFAIVTAHTLRVCNGSGTLLPHLIHGPRGTGKTTALVEAARILLMVRKHLQQGNRILVCTPSNTAADWFAMELLGAGVNPEDVFRLYALKLPVEDLSEEMRPISLVCQNTNGVAQFGIPPLAQLLHYRCIITTITASIYLALGKMSQTFTHIIIDDAGQASELDTLIPLAGLTGPNTKVVLAGDVRPLGPIDTINYFRANNISKSMLARFMEQDSYANDPRTATFLPTPIHPNIQHEESGDNQDGNVGDTGETEENVELNDADMEMVQRALAAPLSDEYTLRDF